MEITYDLNNKKAKEPQWDDKSQSFLITPVVHGNDNFYRDQGLVWGAGIKSEWILSPDEDPVTFKTGLVLKDYDEEDIFVESISEDLIVDDYFLKDDELFLVLGSSRHFKVKTGVPIVSLTVNREVGVSTDEVEDIEEEYEDED